MWIGNSWVKRIHSKNADGTDYSLKVEESSESQSGPCFAFGAVKLQTVPCSVPVEPTKIQVPNS